MRPRRHLSGAFRVLPWWSRDGSLSLPEGMAPRISWLIARTRASWPGPPPASPGSYSSPQLTRIDGQPQCLLLGDHGLTAVDPSTGAVLWQHGPALSGAPRAVQPHRVGPTQ